MLQSVNTRILRDLVSVLKELVQLQRNFYDIPTAEEAERRRIALERLELDRARSLHDHDDSPDTIHVVFDCGDESWNE